MVQLPNIVCMFATVPTKNCMTYQLYGFFVSVLGSLYLKLKDIRLFKSRAYPYSDMSMVLGRTWEANSLSCIFSFQNSCTMTKNDEFCDARNNSTLKATCAHDTGKLPICGNPYLDLAQHGFDLHSCDVRFLKKPNANGHTVTGVFNVSGKWHTAASHNYEGLIQYLLTILYRRRDYIADRHKVKRDAKRK